MKYDVTIGIPMYNVEGYIKRTMESALSQTYQSIEFLVVDDGSSDGSLAIVRNLQSTHPRGNDIRIIVHPKNLGPSVARNRIIDEAKGELEEIRDEEQEAYDTMPEGLQESERGERMSEAIDYLDSAIGSVEEAVDSLNSSME